MRITTTVGAVTALTAGLFLALPAPPSSATPTGVLVMGVTPAAEVVSGQDLHVVNPDPVSAHSLECAIGGAVVAPLGQALLHVMAPVGTIAFCTIDDYTPVVITVV